MQVKVFLFFKPVLNDNVLKCKPCREVLERVKLTVNKQLIPAGKIKELLRSYLGPKTSNERKDILMILVVLVIRPATLISQSQTKDLGRTFWWKGLMWQDFNVRKDLGLKDWKPSNLNFLNWKKTQFNFPTWKKSKLMFIT